MKRRTTSRLGRPAPPPPEHGDWRMSLEHPEEAEHLEMPQMSLWELVQMRAGNLQQFEPEPPVEPIRGWARAWRLTLASLVLLPLSVVMVFALLMQLYHAAPAMGQNFWLSVPVWFTMVGLAGFVSLMVAKFAEIVLIYIYVLGHEATHAVAALLSFGRISAFHFNEQGGYVETDTDNIFIALSPYFVPFWMLVWMLALWLLNLCIPFDAYEPWFYGGMGFWWAYHLYWTFWVIPREQPDMLENGMLFSMLVIVLMNIVVLLGILWFFGVMTPASYGEEFVRCAQRIWETLRFVADFLLAQTA